MKPLVRQLAPARIYRNQLAEIIDHWRREGRHVRLRCNSIRAFISESAEDETGIDVELETLAAIRPFDLHWLAIDDDPPRLTLHFHCGAAPLITLWSSDPSTLHLAEDIAAVLSRHRYRWRRLLPPFASGIAAGLLLFGAGLVLLVFDGIGLDSVQRWAGIWFSASIGACLWFVASLACHIMTPPCDIHW